MEDPAVLDPPLYDHHPPDDCDAAAFPDPFFPDDFPSDLALPPVLMSDLDFDGDIEFSIDDLLNYPEAEGHPPAMGEPGGPASSSQGSDSKEGEEEGSSGVSSSSLPRGNMDQPSDSANSGSDSPARADYAATSPDSGNSATAVPGAADVKLGEQEENKSWGLKRKKEKEDVDGSPNPSAHPRSSKFQRGGGPSDEADSSCLFSAGSGEEERRKARLMRNRESAQLSRQRKKHYVEELEEKVRSMHSTISDLNGKISYIMAENASLRQQLASSGGAKCPPPAVYPGVPPMGPMHFPWVPCSGYPMRPPGSQVPLVPIPRLRTQQTVTPPAKSKKSEGKKGEGKTKKVASVSLLGLLFFMLVVGALVPGFNFRYGNLISDEYRYGKSGTFSKSRGRVLTVSGNFDQLNQTVKPGLCSGNTACKKGSGDHVHGKSSKGSPESSGPVNASEPLFASLYVPRNDKLVKIDGNLIISSVLASEKAMARTSSQVKGHKTSQVSGKGSRETDLAIPGSIFSAMVVANSRRDGGRPSQAYGGPGKHQKALPSGPTDIYTGNSKSIPADRPMQDWFREGLEGPIFSSGMCTEVFKFNASPASGSPGGIVPATSIVSAANNLTENSQCAGKMKNRRILYPQPVPLGGSNLNDTKDGSKRPSENSNFSNTKPANSMVVSVLVDPREAGDGDVDGMIAPKSISRIFVVVLVDSVKYITYSCMLPFKSNAPHLVTA